MNYKNDLGKLDSMFTASLSIQTEPVDLQTALQKEYALNNIYLLSKTTINKLIKQFSQSKKPICFLSSLE